MGASLARYYDRPKHEVRTVYQHLLEQCLRFGAGILTELARRHFSQSGKRGQRRRFLPATVEGKHELYMRMLSQWVSCDDRSHPLEDLVMSPEGKPRVDEPLAYIAALQKESVRVEPHGRRIRHVGKRRVTPQVASLGE
jgi:hypothetical protein